MSIRSPQVKKACPLEETIALNVAYGLYVASGFVKTFVRMRIFMIVVSVAYIVWAILADIWFGVAWNVAFGAVHAYQLAKLWMQQRSISLTDEQADIHKRLFSDLQTIDFFTLWSVGTSRVVEPGTTLISDGCVQRTVMLIIDGTVAVDRQGEQVATLGADSVIGERSYLTGELANATVQAVTSVTLHEWNQEKMKAMAQLCPAAHESMNRHIGLELANKLR